MLKISDIAKHAGVSSTTVSFVLNERHEALRISEKTRIRVLEAAEELGYRSNQWARAMRTGNTRMLGLLGGNPAEEQVGRMMVGALEAAEAQGYTVQVLRLSAFDGNASQIVRRCSELRLMGMLALHLPDHVMAELRAEAQEYGTPLVVVDTRRDNLDLPQVVSDDAGGIEIGVAYLAQMGHAKIAFIDGEGMTNGETTFRKEAFRAAMARHNLMVPPAYIADGHYYYREPSVRAAQSLLTLPLAQRPTAIFCSGDHIALSAMQAANELNLAVPRDVSVIGFSDMRISEFASPPLTTIHQPFEELGRTAVEMLLSVICEKNPTELAATTGSNMTLLPTRLIPRASTAAPNK